MNMFVTRARLALPVAALLASVGCAAETGQSAAPEDVGVLHAAVKDGFGLAGQDADDWNGMVRIWAKNTQFDEVHQYCGGVLITNKLVATAAHCLKFSPDDIEYGWPDVSGDTSALTISSSALNIIADGVGAPFFAPDGRDLAVFRISRGLPVRSRGEIVDSGFFRSVAGTLEDGASLATIGYGETAREVTSDRCKYVSSKTGLTIRGCSADPFELNMKAGTYFSNPPKEVLNVGVSSIPGDSGGATVWGNGELDLADLPLVGINSMAVRCVDNGGPCGAVSARLDDLKTWLGTIAAQ